MRLLLLTAAVAVALSGCDSTGLDASCHGCGLDDGYPTDGGHPTDGGQDDGSDGTDGGETSNADVFLDVDPRQTYLRTNDDHAIDAPALRLADEGFEAGDHVCAVAVGDYFLGDGTRASSRNQPLLTAIFSADGVLAPSHQRVRVKKAVEAGDDVFTPETASGGLATDVSQDFDATAVCVTIPEGANYVFLSAVDSKYGDNTTDPQATQPFGLLIKH